MITVQPPAPLSALEEVPSSDNSPLSSLDAYPVMKAEPSPFSSRPVMFETEEVSSNSSVYIFGANGIQMNDCECRRVVHVNCELLSK